MPHCYEVINLKPVRCVAQTYEGNKPHNYEAYSMQVTIEVSHNGKGEIAVTFLLI